MSILLEISSRLAVALVLGGVIGLEREYRSKEAGFRTHFLVSLGSALFCVVSQYGFGADNADAARVAAQVVSGIGFLGAGTIIFQKNMVRGLTTAAGLWVTAAIGLACGTGMYLAALAATGMVLIGLEVLNALIPRLGTTAVMLTFTTPSRESVRLVMEKIKEESTSIYSYELKHRTVSHGELYDVSVEMRVRRGGHNKRLITYLSEFDDVTVLSLE